MDIRRNMLLLMGLFLTIGLAAQTLKLQPDTTVVYKKAGDVILKVNIFFPEKQDPEKAAMVLFHGGGWNNGRPSYMYRHARYFSHRGLVVFCPEYRLRNKNHTTIVEAVEDAESAVVWVQKHAGAYHFNSDKIIVGGGSAGGHLAIITALDTVIKSGGSSSAYHPDCLVLFNPVLDVSKNGFGHVKIVQELKAYPGINWQDLSPINNIRPGIPPTLVVVGDRDKVLPKNTAVEFEKRMKAAGNDFTLKIYPGGEHTFFNYGYAKKEGYNPKTKNRYYYEVLQEVDDFLVKHSFLAHPAKVLIPADAVYPIKK